MKKKITIVRTGGKNARRKKCEESVTEYPIRKKARWKDKKEMNGRC